jgi:NADH-quinone oxidoreductase subunit A
LTFDQAWPIAVYIALVLVIIAGMLGLSFLLGQRHKEKATNEPYESGILSAGGARLRFTAHFYLIAMMFVIFDLEAVYIYAWAVAARELGWIGYIELLVFVAFLMAAFGYLWRMGAFDVFHRPIPRPRLKGNPPHGG